MTDHEQWLSDTLMSIKGDIGELKGLKDDVAEVKKASDGLLQATATIRSDIEVMKTVRLAHQNDITMLSNRIGVLDQKLENMHTVEIPAIKEQLEVHSWFASNRNKMVAAVGVALLGVAGSVAGSYLGDVIKGTPASLVPSAGANTAPTLPHPDHMKFLPDTVTAPVDTTP